MRQSWTLARGQDQPWTTVPLSVPIGIWMHLGREESHFKIYALVVSLAVLATEPEEDPWGEYVPVTGFPGPVAQNPLSLNRANIKTVLF